MYSKQARIEKSIHRDSWNYAVLKGDMTALEKMFRIKYRHI